jgi:hypothetical protein
VLVGLFALDAAGGVEFHFRARGQCWAAVTKRTFGLDVLACPRCGGRLGLIALIEAAAVIGRILGHLDLSTARAAGRSHGRVSPAAPSSSVISQMSDSSARSIQVSQRPSRDAAPLVTVRPDRGV